MGRMPDRAVGLWALPGFLRTWGIDASAEDLALALTALREAGNAGASELDPHRAADLLRPVFARDLRSWERFPALFEAFWRGEEPTAVSGDRDGEADVRGRPRQPDRPEPKRSGTGAEDRRGTDPDGPRPWADEVGSEGPSDEAERASATGEGERQGRPAAAQDRLPDLLRIYHLLTMPLPGRRYGQAARGQRIHVGRTLALSRQTGGEPMRLSREAVRPPRPHRVLLLDTSTSMDALEGFLERLAAGMQRLPVQAEVYGFAVHLFAWRRHAREGGALWAGGTRIGDSLLEYLHGPGRRLTRASQVLIVSDGWETGSISQLTQALTALTRKAGRVDWACPIAGSDGFEPTCRGLQAALACGISVYDVHDTTSFGHYLQARNRRPHLGRRVRPDERLQGRAWHPARARSQGGEVPTSPGAP